MQIEFAMQYYPDARVFYPGYNFIFGCPRWEHNLRAECVAWCTERFGPPMVIHKRPKPSHPVGRWGRDDFGIYAFRDEADAIEFRLRWT